MFSQNHVHVDSSLLSGLTFLSATNTEEDVQPTHISVVFIGPAYLPLPTLKKKHLVKKDFSPEFCLTEQVDKSCLNTALNN